MANKGHATMKFPGFSETGWQERAACRQADPDLFFTQIMSPEKQSGIVTWLQWLSAPAAQ